MTQSGLEDASRRQTPQPGLEEGPRRVSWRRASNSLPPFLQAGLGRLTLNVPAAPPPGRARPFDAECALQAGLGHLTRFLQGHGASSRPFDAECTCRGRLAVDHTPKAINWVAIAESTGSGTLAICDA